MIIQVLYLIAYLITEFLNYILMYHLVFQIPIQQNRRKLLSGVTILLILHFVIGFICGIKTSESISFITMLVIPIFCLEQDKDKYKLYPYVVIGTSVFVIAASFAVALIMHLPEVSIGNSGILLLVCQSIPTVLLLLFGVLKRKGYYFEKPRLHRVQYFILYTSIICVYFLLAWLQAFSADNWTEETFNIYGLLASITGTVLLMLVLWQCVVQSREECLKVKTDEYERYMLLQEKYFSQIIEQDNRIRGYRHDMAAHLAVLGSFCENGEVDKLEGYIKEIEKNYCMEDLKYHTGSRSVDAVINQVAGEYEKKEISLVVEGNIPTDCKIQAYDLCTIFYNLLQNAEEACLRQKEEERKVLISNNSYQDILFIIVKNTADGAPGLINGRLHTTKPDREAHGIGSINIENTVRKYHGSIQYQYDNGWVSAEIKI